MKNKPTAPAPPPPASAEAGVNPASPPAAQIESAWWKRGYGVVIFVIGLIVGISSGGWAVFVTTKTTAEQAVLDEEFVDRLTRQVRPFLVIDLQNKIQSNFGGSEKVESIKFEHIPTLRTNFQGAIETNYLETELVIDLKQHHDNAPLVQPMTGRLFIYSVERGERHRWIYRLRRSIRATDDGSLFGIFASDPTDKDQFHVEILP